MSRIHAEVTRVIDARPADVFGFLADYRDKRARILPSNYLDYTVEQGGRGAGTVMSYRLRAARRERPYRMQVEEPSKGRVLLERDTTSSLVTTWQVAPVADSRQARVTVSTDWEGGRGVGGFFERTFAPAGLRRIHAEMLERLAQAVGGGGASRRRVAS